jgi:hypothetical protein
MNRLSSSGGKLGDWSTVESPIPTTNDFITNAVPAKRVRIPTGVMQPVPGIRLPRNVPCRHWMQINIDFRSRNTETVRPNRSCTSFTLRTKREGLC